MRSRRMASILLAATVVVAACDSGDAESATTTITSVTATTETPEPATTTTTEGAESTTPTTIRVGQTVAEFEITLQIPTDNGEILYIVIPPGAYTDVDLENFLGDLKEADPDLWGAEVFDDADAVQAFVIPEDQRTAEQQQLLDDHHYVSLIGGDTVKYRGPFAEFGEFIIGS